MYNIHTILIESLKTVLLITTNVLKIIYLSLACFLMIMILILIQNHYKNNPAIHQDFYKVIIDSISKNQSFKINNLDCKTTTTVNEDINNIELHCEVNKNITAEVESNNIE